MAKVRLYMPNPGDAEDVLAIETLKPAAWVTRRGVAPGAEVWVPIDESGLAGWARVDDVLPCPSVRRGPGRVVLTTVTHVAPEMLEFVFEGADPPLRTTGNHEFYSATRGTWIPAVLLVAGEEVETRAGATRILRIDRKEGPARVFNLEVEGEHCYHVTAVGVVTHNCGQGVPGPVKDPLPQTYDRGATHADHIKARSLGGANAPSNIRPLPAETNIRKGGLEGQIKKDRAQYIREGLTPDQADAVLKAEIESLGTSPPPRPMDPKWFDTLEGNR